MGTAIDIVLAAVVIVFAGLAYKKGFLRTIFEVVAVILAIFCAFKVAEPASKTIYKNFLEENITKKIEDTLPETSGIASYSKKAEVVVECVPEFIFSVAKGTGITKEVIAQKIGAGNYNGATAADGIVKNIVEPIAVPVLKSIFFMVFALVFAFLLRYFAKLISVAVTKDKGISVNKLLGCIFGAAKGFVAVYLICALIQMLAYSKSFQATEFAKSLSDSAIFVWMTTKNPVIMGLKNIF